MKRTLCLILALLMALASLAALAAPGDELTPYKDGKRWGYQDATGKTVIKPQFVSAQPFHNGLAVVQISQSGYAVDEYIDPNGKVVIGGLKTKSNLYTFNEWQGEYGIVEVWDIKSNGSITTTGLNYVDLSGKLVYDGRLLYTGLFHEGYALVGTGSASGKLHRASSEEGEHWLTSNGNRAATQFFYIDAQGNPLGSSTWAFGGPFSGGYAPVAVAGADGSLLWGLIDEAGNVAASPAWAEIAGFSNGLARVKDGDRYGFIDASGALAIPCEWEYAGNFSADGLAAVRVNGLYGFIDATGAVVIEPAYAQVSDFADGYASVSDGASCGIIDTQGNAVVEPIYASITRIPGTGLFDAANADGGHLLLGADGQPLGDTVWDGIKAEASTPERICVLQNNLYGFVDGAGALVIAPQYTDATAFQDGLATVWIGDNAMTIDLNGDTPYPTLSKGSKGDDVKRLQEALIEQGYLDGKADGDFGGKTEAAVLAAQAAFGMEETGVADHAFQKRLYNE